MNAVDFFCSIKSNIPNNSAVVFEKYKGERAGFDVHIFTHPKNVPLVDLCALHYRVTEKCIVDTDKGDTCKGGYRLLQGKLARITIPIRTVKDPVIPFIANLIGTKAEKVIITLIRNCDDLTIIRAILEGTTFPYLKIVDKHHFHDA
ncbi:hypothetical protein PFISCL1PPCAC_12392, partial [Pristionchus fissidentatus]